MRLAVSVVAIVLTACSAPTDERATLDGSVAHPRCESCHVRDYEAVVDPPHAGELPTTCFVCHTQDAWRPARLEHGFYPLSGAHLEARCLSCHRMGTDDNEPRFEGTPGECVHCHRDDYDRSTFPGHQHFALTCADCHSTAAWRPTLHPPQPDAWSDTDAGLAGLLDGITGPSGWGSGPLEPPPAPIDAGTDAGHDAGRRRPPHHVPPPTTGTTDTPPPPTTVVEDPPDVIGRPSHRGR
jgi:hypothetical protein